jgi:hypothetical protein
MRRSVFLASLVVFVVVASSCQDNQQATPDPQTLQKELTSLGVPIESLSVDTIHVVVVFPYPSDKPTARRDMLTIVKAMCKDFRLYYLDASFSDKNVAYVNGEMVLRFCQGRYTDSELMNSITFTSGPNK